MTTYTNTELVASDPDTGNIVSVGTGPTGEVYLLVRSNGINAIVPLTIDEALALSRAAMRAACAGDMSAAGLRKAQRLSRRKKSARRVA